MIVAENNSKSAAYSLYQEMGSKVSLPDCAKLTEIMEYHEPEIPMGMSEKRYKKFLIRKMENDAAASGVKVYSSSIFGFLIMSAVQMAIRKLVEHWLSKKGWV